MDGARFIERISVKNLLSFSQDGKAAPYCERLFVTLEQKLEWQGKGVVILVQ